MKNTNKKMLKVLIATNFVGIITTPIVLTSCSKKISYNEEILKLVKFEEKDIKTNKNNTVNDVKFPNLFDKNNTKTFEYVVGDSNTNIKEFTIYLTVPFEERSFYNNKKNEKDKTFEWSYERKSVGCKKDEHGVSYNFLSVEEKQDENNKKIWKYIVTFADDIKKIAEPKKDSENKDLSQLDPKEHFATIKFTFKPFLSLSEKSAEFIYKITFAEKNK